MKRNLRQVYFFPQVELRTRYLSATCRSQLRLPHRVLHRFRQTVWHSRPGWSIVVWPLIGRCFTARSIDDIGDHECPATSMQHRIRNLMFCESWSVLLSGNDESFKAFKEPCPNCHSAEMQRRSEKSHDHFPSDIHTISLRPVSPWRWKSWRSPKSYGAFLGCFWMRWVRDKSSWHRHGKRLPGCSWYWLIYIDLGWFGSWH